MNDENLQPQEIKNDTPLEPQKRKSNTKKIIIAICLSLILIGGAVGLFAYMSMQNKETTSDQSAKKDIANLRVGMMGEEINLNYPASDIGASQGGVEMSTQVFEGLVQYKDLTKIQPLLAESWSNPNGDTSTWNFELQKNIKFHTGRTMTAEDVKFSIEALQAADTATAQQFASTIKSVTVTSPYKVQIKTTGPDPLLLNKLAYVYILDSKSKTPNSPINGTGPFVVKPGSKPTTSSIELTPFEGYHGGHSYVRSLSFKIYSDYDKMLSDLKDKKLDLGGDVSNVDLGKFPAGKYSKLVDDGAVTIYLASRVAKGGPIAKKEVREALDILVDQKKYFEKTGFSGTPANQLIPSQLTGHKPSIEPRQVDVAKAKDLLTKAGYPNGLTLKLYHFDNISDAALKQLSDDAAKGGITLDIQPFPNQDNPDESISSNSMDLFIYGWSSAVIDGVDFLSEGVIGATGTTDEKLLNDVDAAQLEFDPAKRLQLLQDASQRVFDEALISPLYNRTYYQISTNPSYVFKQEISGTSRGIYYWQTYQK